MENVVKEAIKKLTERASNAGNAGNSGDAMRLAQAALSLAHVLAVNANTEIERKRNE